MSGRPRAHTRALRFAGPFVLIVCAFVACGEKHFEPPAQQDRVGEAEGQFSPQRFDTIQWQGRNAMLIEGAAVYAANCRDCHGPMGKGNTDYARSRALDVPSLVQPGWPYRDNLPAVRMLVFTGHSGGMPTHGIGGISAREIDAVSRYLLEQLRPEVDGSP